jgi:superfamily I DNA and/or RNA helicase
MRLFDVPSQARGSSGPGSWCNPGQTKVAADLIRFLMSQKDRWSLENGIGIITPYNEQTRQLEQCLLGANIFQHKGEMEQHVE